MKMANSAVSLVLLTIISCISAESNCRKLITNDGRRGVYLCIEATLDDVNDISDDAEWIQFTVSKFPHIPERAFARFPLHGLSFYKCDIGHIDPDAFDQLGKLQRLIFYASNVHVLKASWFKGLSRLTHLFLDGNSMVYIEPNVFSLISNLEQLNIEDNNLNCLPSETLASLRKLKYARIGKNPWLCSCYEELAGWLENRQINHGLKNTTKERLECMMDHVPERKDFMAPPYKTFSNFSVSETGYMGTNTARDVVCFGNDISVLSQIPNNVKSIKFVNSEISKIPRFAFLRFGNSLTSLYFRNCDIREIHPDAFAGLPKLKLLFLFGNSFSTVRSEWFRDLHSLENLALDNNGIDYIEPSVFPFLDKLEHWSLGNNKIQCIPTNELKSLRSLKEVILAHNPWNCSCQENLRKWLHENRVRYVISRGQCINGHIEESEDLFEQSFERRKAKDESDNTGSPEMTTNYRHQVPVDAELYDNISTAIEISSDQRAEITQEQAEHDLNIAEANYEHHRIEAESRDQYHTRGTRINTRNHTDSNRKDDVNIPPSHDYELDKPSLSDTQNSYISVGGGIWDVLSISSDAQAIRFENCAMPKILNGILARFGNSLRRLEFLNCMIQDIEPQAFAELTNLQELILNGNQIRVVRSGWFEGISNLRRLNLAGNSITQIDSGVFRLWTNLEHLDISNNRLNCLDMGGLSHLTNLNTINIGNNPWSCLCQSKLNEWLDERGDNIKDSFDETGDWECSAEDTDFRMTNNQETNSIDMEVSNIADENIRQPKDMKGILKGASVALNLEKTQKTSLNETENLETVKIEVNNADLNPTASEVRTTTQKPATPKPKYSNDPCRFYRSNRKTESRWECNGGDISVLDDIPSSAERIHIIDSNISAIPAYAFARFTNLTRLIFYNNSIRDIEPFAFATLNKLEWLILLNNSLPTIRSSWFHDLGNVTVLGLVSNSIKEIESDVFEYLPNLKRLAIQDNNLRCIYTKSLSSLKYLHRVTIEDNPWKWRCREELIQFFEARNISYVRSESFNEERIVTDLLIDDNSEPN